MTRNPAGGAEVLQPGGYEKDAGTAFGAGTDSLVPGYQGQLHPSCPACQGTGEAPFEGTELIAACVKCGGSGQRARKEGP